MIGLYFEVSAPIVRGGDYLFTLRNFTEYSHNIAAIGGFWDAALGQSIQQNAAEDWYELGLGRGIHAKNQFGGTVWKGFVNKINITAGSQTLTRGPLLEVVNRATCVYTPRDFSVYPPVDGTTTTTIIAEDLPSQVGYGIFEQATAGGTTSEANAEKMRDVFLEQNRLPKTTGDFSITGTGAPISVSLELLGNIHWLMVYPYNNLAPAVITAYTKLLQILNANVNPGVFSLDYSNISANVYAMEQLEDKTRFAWDIVNELLALGNDTTDDRRIFGLYEEDKFDYRVIPSTISYEYKLSSQKQQVVDYTNNALVYPYDIRPGKWIRTSDWLIGRVIDSTDLQGDPRNKFIENVNFSSPYTVGITGSPFDKLSQMLAKITYTGGIY